MKALWIICLILAIVCIGLEIKSIFSTNEKSLVRLIKMVLFLAASAFFLYLPVYFLQNDFLSALFADLINIMRVVTMDSGYLDSKEFIELSIGSGTFFRLYMDAMGLMHFLMPLLSIMAIYSLFFMFISHMRLTLINIQIYRPVFLFNSTDKRSVLLAADMQKQVSKGAFIFTDIQDKSQSGDVDVLSSTIIHPDNIENIKIRRTKNRDVFYFLLSDDENTNIKQALDQIRILSGEDEEIQKHTHIYVSVISNEAEILIDSSEKEEVDIHILRMEEIAVYNLINEHPLYEGAKGNLISILVFGMDTIGETFVRAASWCGQLQDYQLKINVVGIGIADKIREFKFRYPGYEGCGCLELNFYDCSDNQDAFDTIIRCCADTTYAVVADGTDMENTETAIRLRREFLKQGGLLPGIHAYIRNKEEAEVLNNLMTSEINSRHRVSYRLASFGCDEDIFTGENVIDPELECLGINVYLMYEAIALKQELNISEALKRCNSLEVNKRSNVAYAMHIGYKLAQLGLDYTDDTEAEEVDFESYLTEEKLQEMALVEHDRSQMFIISEGWTGATMSEVEAFKASGLSPEKYFTPLQRVNPFICPYDELEARSECIGIENVANNDRELIRRIPDILHDRWNVTGVRYKIVKMGQM